MSWRFRIYLAIAGFFIRILRKPTGLSSFQQAAPLNDPVIWFHAASAGELESLWPVAQETLKTSNVVLSIFSASAAKGARRFQMENESRAGKLVVLESPAEGDWTLALNRYSPRALVSAKYEAWPDLWKSVANRKVPLVIVGAKWRPSFESIQKLSKILGFKMPDLRWVCDEDVDLKTMLSEFPGSQGKVDSDPRWDRVSDRLRTGSPRAREILEAFQGSPRPWGILGSAWASDLNIVLPALQQSGFKGSLWVVPHHVKGSELDQVLLRLKSHGLAWARSSDLAVRPDPGRGAYTVNLIDEMGVLNELYSKMDWVYVGGGFEKGVHSTIEPALSLKPMSCGTIRADRFPEIAFLKEAGMLTQIQSSEDFENWLKKMAISFKAVPPEWTGAIEKKQGSAQRIAKWILEQV